MTLGKYFSENFSKSFLIWEEEVVAPGGVRPSYRPRSLLSGYSRQTWGGRQEVDIQLYTQGIQTLFWATPRGGGCRWTWRRHWPPPGGAHTSPRTGRRGLASVLTSARRTDGLFCLSSLKLSVNIRFNSSCPALRSNNSTGITHSVDPQ